MFYVTNSAVYNELSLFKELRMSQGRYSSSNTRLWVRRQGKVRGHWRPGRCSAWEMAGAGSTGWIWKQQLVQKNRRVGYRKGDTLKVCLELFLVWGWIEGLGGGVPVSQGDPLKVVVQSSMTRVAV